MPRIGRLAFPGAVYHIINRGNYRRDLFADDSTRAAFEDCLFAACTKSAWLLHAFVIMRNHFHLALETPEANLIAGMQWLQGTFANRFNRFRDERGHLFQGRYKSLLIDTAGKALGEVCDYIHLNPVAAGIADLDRLADFRWSSLWYFHRQAERPAFLHSETAFARAGIPTGDARAWDLYVQRLSLQRIQDLENQSRGRSPQRSLERGWALGSEAFKQAMSERDNAVVVARDSGAAVCEELRNRQWSLVLKKALDALGRTEAEAGSELKSERWKLAIAAWMRDTTQTNRRWLCTKLNLGTPGALSHNLSLFSRLHRSSDPHYAVLKALSSS